MVDKTKEMKIFPISMFLCSFLSKTVVKSLKDISTYNG